MTEQEMRRGGGGKLARTETVTVRLDPKLRYLAELAARVHRRTLSSYIEWAIKESLDKDELRPANALATAHSDRTVGSESEYLWDVDEADRFAKLALRYPQLLSHEDQVKWKLICENGYFWRHSRRSLQHEWTWTVDEASFLFGHLREQWEAVCIAAETGHDELLPEWGPPIGVGERLEGSPGC